MWDASDHAVGVILGQRRDKKPYVIYYASKMLDEAQQNYTTTEKESRAVVYVIEKFRLYLLCSRVTEYTDHSTLKCEFGELFGMWDHTAGYELKSQEAIFPPSQNIFLGGTLFV